MEHALLSASEVETYHRDGRVIPEYRLAPDLLADLTELGPFRIERMLGSGGMGTVYRATDSRSGKTIALKLATLTSNGSMPSTV